MDILYVVKARDLVLNITFAWEGAIALAQPSDDGCLVSHRFPTYEVDEEAVNRDFLGYALNNRHFFRALASISPGSAGRNRVLNQRDFLNLTISLPSRARQDQAAELLIDADRDIAATSVYLSRLRLQKRGLMQKLLTGRTRVLLGDLTRLEAAAD